MLSEPLFRSIGCFPRLRCIGGECKPHSRHSRIQAHQLRIRLLRVESEHFLCQGKYQRRSQRLAVKAYLRTGQNKLFMREAQSMIYQRVFPPEFPVSAADRQAVFGKQIAFILRKQPSATAFGRQAAVAAAHHNQSANISPPHSVKITSRYAVERYRNHPDVITRQNSPEQPVICVPVHGDGAQDHNSLLNCTRNDVPKLKVFGFQFRISFSLQIANSFLQGSPDIGSIQKRKQRLRLIRSRFCRGNALLQQQKRGGNMSARKVERFQARICFLISRFSITIRMLLPVARTQPCRAV